jgi:hypothetical protein
LLFPVCVVCAQAVKTVFQYLNCRQVGTHLVVSAYPSIDCRSEHYLRFSAWIYLQAAVFVIAFPVCVAALLIVSRRRQLHHKPKFVRLWGFLYSESVVLCACLCGLLMLSDDWGCFCVFLFRYAYPRGYLFELVFLGARAMLVFASEFSDWSDLSRVRAFALTCLALQLVFVSKRPYRSRLENGVGIVALSLLIAVTVFATTDHDLSSAQQVFVSLLTQVRFSLMTGGHLFDTLCLSCCVVFAGSGDWSRLGRCRVPHRAASWLVWRLLVCEVGPKTSRA